MTLAHPVTRLVGYLVDDHVGVLRGVTGMRINPGAPEFFHFSAQLCNTGALGLSPGVDRAGAAGIDRDATVTAAITDAIANYCASFRSEDNERVPVCPFKTAPFSCVAPDEFILFGERQYEEPGFPWVRFAEQTPVHWTRATDLGTDDEKFLPSAMVFLPYEPRPEHGEAPIVPPTSTGLACHWDPARAALEAVCDVIECDSLALTWQSQLAMPQVRIETLSDANYDMVSRFERTGAYVRLLKLDLGLGVATFLAALANPSPGAPALVFGAGTDPDAELAVRRALQRLAHAEQWCQFLRQSNRQAPADMGDLIDQSHHLSFWCDPRNKARADFLFDSGERLEFDALETQSTGSHQRDLRQLLGRLESSGHRVFVIDLTSPDIANLGLLVLRAVIPGLHPLFYGFRTRALGGNRLWRWADKERGDNTLPHPFSRKGVLE